MMKLSLGLRLAECLQFYQIDGMCHFYALIVCFEIYMIDCISCTEKWKVNFQMFQINCEALFHLCLQY